MKIAIVGENLGEFFLGETPFYSGLRRNLKKNRQNFSLGTGGAFRSRTCEQTVRYELLENQPKKL